ncbi:GH1 family beta-glucosidase [Goodfellowiella coeruleoviolacea]|uniref:Beta-glucosidase n=1 Tax=Goodfellowiella coeruleoviolacea TaxID=334858 RepID=A0AAE3KIP1_9PSEU|nr:GH1 family beta-glucosidase [Goodfellowiella coeruleoviolacea]MCP2163478.1 broad-specificity cellobiase (EC 3.2.1.21) [Goodfellowiella coeruleoviolacea]
MDTSAPTVGTDTGTDTEAELIATLPPTFDWGVATSAYQIEGAVTEDGRGPSIWDTYCRLPGAVDGGDTGDVACDHYHRMPEDVALMRQLGVNAYRFSVAWPRVQPGGRGPANPAGLAFYDRLVDELLANGIDPWLTLYHWDLPQELEDAGGWPVRDTAHRFADYAMLVFDALRDRVRHWTTLNEPWCSAMLGYHEGRQAPGRQDFPASIAAVHHLLLGHGLATQRMRAAADGPAEFAITLNMSQLTPATDSEADRAATRRADGLGVRIYLDPLVRGHYPADVVEDLALAGVRIPVRDGDLDVIATPIDLLGVNYYFSSRCSGVDDQGRSTGPDGRPVHRDVRLGRPVTAMDWEIVPDGLTDLLIRLSHDYPGLPLVITENGAAFRDEPDETGFVRDGDRVAYLAAHLAAVARARLAGADVRGYFAWSLLDNFEWSYGYDKRFGLVRVDYDTQRRVPKQSALWYRDTINRVRQGA